MSQPEGSVIDFELLCTQFPKHGGRIRHLLTQDAEFLDVCEDYCLAESSLRRMESEPTDRWKVEIAEYRIVLRELKNEIARLLLSKGGLVSGGPSSGHRLDSE
jgi:hypothetical protein